MRLINNCALQTAIFESTSSLIVDTYDTHIQLTKADSIIMRVDK